MFRCDWPLRPHSDQFRRWSDKCRAVPSSGLWWEQHILVFPPAAPQKRLSGQSGPQLRQSTRGRSSWTLAPGNRDVPGGICAVVFLNFTVNGLNNSTVDCPTYNDWQRQVVRLQLSPKSRSFYTSWCGAAVFFFFSATPTFRTSTASKKLPTQKWGWEFGRKHLFPHSTVVTFTVYSTPATVFKPFSPRYLIYVLCCAGTVIAESDPPLHKTRFYMGEERE